MDVRKPRILIASEFVAECLETLAGISTEDEARILLHAAERYRKFRDTRVVTVSHWKEDFIPL
jgi:hypothetical protein